MKNTFSIKEISERFGISSDTLRYYDKIKLVSPNRGENNYRYYDENNVLQLQYTSVMKYAGFSLGEIKIMLNLMNNDPSDECKKQSIEILTKKHKEIADFIHNYSNLLKLLEESISISQNIEIFPEEHNKIDEFVIKIFDDINKQL